MVAEVREFGGTKADPHIQHLVQKEHYNSFSGIWGAVPVAKALEYMIIVKPRTFVCTL